MLHWGTYLGYKNNLKGSKINNKPERYMTLLPALPRIKKKNSCQGMTTEIEAIRAILLGGSRQAKAVH